MQPFEIEDIKRLNVAPGDVLLVTVPQHTTMQQAADIKNTFETQLPVRAIVMSSGIQVEVAAEQHFRNQQAERLTQMITGEEATR